MTNNELLEMVRRSFLPDAQKRDLSGCIEDRGGDSDFFRIFNQYLIEDIRRRGERYMEKIHELDEEFGKLESEMRRKRSEVGKDTDEKLAKTDPHDFSSREKIWDEHYERIEALHKQQEERLKAITSGIIRSLM